MLKKLIKHDFIAIGRLGLPIIGVEIILILITGIVSLLPLKNEILIIFTYLLFLAIVFISLLAFMALFILPLVRFYKNFLSGEGYLTFTLPVTTHQLLISKLITGSVTLFVNVLVYFSGLLVLIMSNSQIRSGGSEIVKEIFRSILNELFGNPNKRTLILSIVVIVFVFLVSLVWSQMVYFLSISLGQVLCKNKILGAFVAYLVINFVVQIITFMSFLLAALFSGINNFITSMSTGEGMIVLYGIIGVESLILCVISYFITHKCLTKKLNLS